MVFLNGPLRGIGGGADVGTQSLAGRLARRGAQQHNHTREQHQRARPVVVQQQRVQLHQQQQHSSRLSLLANAAATADAAALPGCWPGEQLEELAAQQQQQAAAAFNHLASLANSHQQQQAPAAARRRSSSTGGGTNSTATTATTNISSSSSGRESTAAAATSSSGSSAPLPEQLLRLADASAPVALPPPRSVSRGRLDNRELDKLVGTLGRNKATWRRALVLLQWLQEARHALDDRLCTTLIRVCSEHGQAVSALAVYDWMQAAPALGGAGLAPSVFTYTAAMRAALAAGLLDRALAVWEDAQAAQCQLDCRLCITYIEVCSRKGLTERALAMYAVMHDAPRGSKLAPTVHAYTAAMRAATEGGRWAAALDIWADMAAAGVAPTGHAFAAAMSACAAGCNWRQAVGLFEDMCAAGIRPDVVSCTALISALAAAGQAARAESVVQWMLSTGVRPNVRTYTALLTALGRARQWDRAFEMLRLMQTPAWGSVAPNSFTYSALLRCLGECGEWQRAEQLFCALERQALQHQQQHQQQQQQQHQQQQQAAALASVGSSIGSLGSSAAGLAAVATMAVMSGQQAAPGDSGAVPGGVWGPQRPTYFGEADLHSLAGSTSGRPAAAAGAAAAGTGGVGEQQQQGQLWTSASQLHGLHLQLQDEAAAAGQSTISTADSRSPDPPGSAAAQPPGSSSSSSADALQPLSAANSSSVAQQLAQLALQQQFANAADLQLLLHQQQAQAAAAAAANQAHQHQQPAAAPGSSSNCGGGSSKHGAGGAKGSSSSSSSSSGAGLVNEVVVRSLMLAYEQAGRWQQCIGALARGAALGVAPSPAMYAIALGAAGKAGQLALADALFAQAAAAGAADASTYETMVAVLGMAGDPARAEVALRAMTAAGHTPGDYAHCGLIAGYSLAGDAASAQRVRGRIIRARGPGSVSVHVYNALLAAADRAGAYDRALELLRVMRVEGVEPDALTQTLAADVGRKGAVEVEGQQLTAAALSAAMAAAGTLLIRSGVF